MDHHHVEYDPVSQKQVRGRFVSRIGFMLAAVGSAVGLGNIWKFPYIMGENGGAWFLLVYLFCIAFVGLPVLVVEFVIGRKGQTSAVSSYRCIAPGKPWFLNGYLGVITAFIILSFYSAVAGWVLKYFVIGVTQGFSAYSAANPDASGTLFTNLIKSEAQPLIYQLITMALTATVIFFGIEKGIERASKWMMPLLFLILLLLLVRSLTLPNAFEGVRFMFEPGYGEKLGMSGLTWKSVLVALGHSFFTLSVGMGVMITYASYIDRDIHLGKVGAQVAVLDTMFALLAGLVIFPAVFSAGLNPGGGPGLLFITLPQVFAEMPLGRLAGSAFFFLVFIAAMTSTISIIEPVVTWLVDDLNFKRHNATALAAVAIYIVGIPACLSATSEGAMGWFRLPFIGMNPDTGQNGIIMIGFFDWLDKLSSLIMLPLGGLVSCAFLVWGWRRRQEIMDEMSGTAGRWNHWTVKLWYWIAVTIAPIGILAMLVFGVAEQAGLWVK